MLHITTMTSMEVWYVEPPNLVVSVRRMQLKEGLFWRPLKLPYHSLLSLLISDSYTNYSFQY
ncbi:hypothetical protein CFP56_036678 [Quercus suber]|uniref:Uncharacterized protein n=1 Tax=Quercus suber TaxID=58331 RepID=A0AAW0MD30_QUESU